MRRTTPASPDPSSRSRSSHDPRLGPWGTTRETERQFGYPQPRRPSDRELIQELEARIRELKRSRRWATRPMSS